MRKFVNYWLPVLIWMSVIFFFSSRQRVKVADDLTVNFIFFKFLHLAEYAFLMMLNFRAIKSYYKIDKNILYMAAFMLTFIYAVSDEYHQSLIPTREPRFRDVIIDAAGAIIIWIIIDKLLPKAPQKLKKLARNLQII